MDQKTDRKKLTFPVLKKILKDTFQGFGDDNVMKLSASLAYATLFSIIPFLSLIITIGTFFHTDLISLLYTQLQPVVGSEVVEQLRGILDNAAQTGSSVWTTIISLGVTIFGATAIFSEMQSSLNTIWSIKAVPKRGWLRYIRNRLMSFAIIIVFAFILLITFGVSNIINNLSGRLLAHYPDTAQWLVSLVGIIVNIGVTALIFTLIFKILPDAKVKIKDILTGALVTTLLFMIGQWGISFYFGIANVGSIYGAAAFIAILLTWIYYSAIIIYIGAEFTEAWANEMGGRIIPEEFAVATKIVEIHEDKPVETINKTVIEK